MMKSFEIGDRVIATISSAPIKAGDLGTIVGFWDIYEEIVHIEWDKPNSIKHNCDGKCENHHGWNLLRNEIELCVDVSAISISEKQLGDLL